MIGVRLAILTDIFQDLPLEQALDEIAPLGFAEVEIAACWNWVDHVHFPTLGADRLARICDRLTSTGLRVSAVATYPDIASLLPAERRRAVDFCLSALRRFPDLRCQTMTLMLGGSNLLPRDAQEQACRTSLVELADAAAAVDTELAVEIYPGNFIESTAEAVALLRDMKLPNVGYLLCVPHIAALGEDPGEAYEAARPLVRYIHLADTPVGTGDHKHYALGCGEVDFPALFRRLRRDAYDGVICLQIYSSAETPHKSARESLAAVQFYAGRGVA